MKDGLLFAVFCFFLGFEEDGDGFEFIDHLSQSIFLDLFLYYRYEKVFSLFFGETVFVVDDTTE